MAESGLLKNWISKWIPNNLQCKGLGPVTQSKQATVSDFQGAFYLLVIGIILAVVIVVVESVISYPFRKSHSLEINPPVVAISSRVAAVSSSSMEHSTPPHLSNDDVFARRFYSVRHERTTSVQHVPIIRRNVTFNGRKNSWKNIRSNKLHGRNGARRLQNGYSLSNRKGSSGSDPCLNDRYPWLPGMSQLNIITQRLDE